LVLDLVRLARPHTCVAGFIEVLLGACLVDRSRVFEARPLMAAVSAVFLIATAQSYNDALDAVADQPTKPDRPVASGRISVKTAKWYAVVCAVAGISLIVPLASMWMVRAAVFAAVMSFAYSLWLKNTILVGNAAVATSAMSLVE
jgi:geranylgeranylglycerol-phosphate geranylgeranyltransferase